MGGSSSKSIAVGTINYAGITYNPFEFYSADKQDEQELKDLSYIFKQLAEQKVINRSQRPQQFDWGIKTIQKKMHKQRYSPVYRPDVGVLHGRLLTQKEFKQKWNEQFQKNKHFVNFSATVTRTEEQMCQTYDCLLYKTFVEYIYNTKIQKKSDQKEFEIEQEDRLRDQNKNLTKEVRAQIMGEYLNFLERHFEKPYLKHKVKLQAIKTMLESKDVLFVQDVSEELINSLRNEGHINVITPSKTYDCTILVKKDKFVTLYDEQAIHKQALIHKNQNDTQKQLFLKKAFDFEMGMSTPAICFVDDYMFINFHLHKPESIKTMNKNSAFLRIMNHLNKIHKLYPSLKIVAGGDLFLQVRKDEKYNGTQFSEEEKTQIQREFFQNFQFYPKEGNKPTTKKTRTWLQSQIQKADDDKDSSCRDYILTTMKIENGKIEKLGSFESDTHILTEKHPFDHYLVSVTLSS